MMAFQILQTLFSKLVGALGRRRLPSTGRGSEQQSCCDGVCEVHEIGGG